MLPREVVATIIDGTLEFCRMLSPESTGSECVDSGNFSLRVLAEDLSDFTFCNGTTRAGDFNPVFAYRVWVILASSQAEVQYSLCSGCASRLWAWVFKSGMAVVGQYWTLKIPRGKCETYTAPEGPLPNENTWKRGSAH